MIAHSKYKHEDVPKHYIKVYAHRNNKWGVYAYQCPDCGITYKSLRAELFKHEDTCKGPKTKPSLED